jgi:hypothetical protein
MIIEYKNNKKNKTFYSLRKQNKTHALTKLKPFTHLKRKVITNNNNNILRCDSHVFYC